MAGINENVQKYLDLKGLTTFWGKVKEYIISQQVTEAAENGNTYVKVSKTNASETSGAIYKIDESALVTKLNKINEDIAEIKDNGVDSVSIKGVDDSDYVQVSVNAADGSGKAKGDVEITVNATKLEEVITGINTKISALVRATEFVGVVNWDPSNVTIDANNVSTDNNGVTLYPIAGENVPADTKLQNGDIVIYGDKEYILDANFKDDNNPAPRFVELGDTTAEGIRLNDIETWINAPITDEDILALFTIKTNPEIPEN